MFLMQFRKTFNRFVAFGKLSVPYIGELLTEDRRRLDESRSPPVFLGTYEQRVESEAPSIQVLLPHQVREVICDIFRPKCQERAKCERRSSSPSNETLPDTGVGFSYVRETRLCYGLKHIRFNRVVGPTRREYKRREDTVR